MGKTKFVKDALGTRMKEFYENRTKLFLPRRTFTIIRIDGKAFHTYTKGLKRPFDSGLIEDMDKTACYLCKNIQGAKFAFVQSDEISIILTDFDKIETDAWFDGNAQKMTSVSASLATAIFNRLRAFRYYSEIEVDPEEHGQTAYDSAVDGIFNLKLAMFDSRVFTIPSLVEVENYFIWRQQDTTRNSVSSVAQNMFSDLDKKSTKDMLEMCLEKGVDWNDFSNKEKYGRLIVKKVKHNEKPFPHSKSTWESIDAPIFMKDKMIFDLLIPKED